MLSNRTANQPSTFTIAVAEDDGTPIEATTAAWSLFDERGLRLAASDIAGFEPNSSEVTFALSASDLALLPAETSAGREIVVTLGTPAGPTEIRDYFVLVAANPLKLMSNSFVTYPEALATRGGFGPTLSGWDAAEPADRTSALADAHQRLNRMTFTLPLIDGMERASSYAAYGLGTDEGFDTTRRVRLATMSLADFDALPEAFRKALKRAQLAEADVILGGDVVGRMRRDGIVSKTVGESSSTFSDRPYLNLPISRQAYDEVQRYVVFRVGVARG